MTRQQILDKINENIKVNSNRVSPTKTTGSMLKEALVTLTPFNDEHERANSETLTYDQYMDKFLEDPYSYDYNNLEENKFTLNSQNSNFLLDLIRKLAQKTSKPSTAYFDREAKFIVGREITDDLLRSMGDEWLGWWVADGTNNTDDMRGMIPIGGGARMWNTYEDRTSLVPYEKSYQSTPLPLARGEFVGDRSIKLDDQKYYLKHSHDMEFRFSGAEKDDQIKFLQPKGWSDGTYSNEGGGDGSGTTGNVLVSSTDWGYTSPRPLGIYQPAITGTWIQYVKPDEDIPTAPVLSLISNNATTASFRWTASSDSSGIQKYVLVRSGNGEPYDVQSITPNYSTKTMVGLTPGKTYDFKIRAQDIFDKYGEWSNVVRLTMPEADTEGPSAPQITSVSNFTLVRENQRWIMSGTANFLPSTDNEAVKEYTLYTRFKSTDSWNSGISTVHNQGQDFYSLLGGNVTTQDEQPTSLQYKVVAKDNSGNTTDSNIYTATLGSGNTTITGRPQIGPANRSIISVNDGSGQLEYSYLSFPFIGMSSGASSYRLQISYGTGTNYLWRNASNLVNNSSSTDSYDTNLLASSTLDVTYAHVRVVALNSSGSIVASSDPKLFNVISSGTGGGTGGGIDDSIDIK